MLFLLRRTSSLVKPRLEPAGRCCRDSRGAARVRWSSSTCPRQLPSSSTSIKTNVGGSASAGCLPQPASTLRNSASRPTVPPCRSRATKRTGRPSASAWMARTRTATAGSTRTTSTVSRSRGRAGVPVGEVTTLSGGGCGSSAYRVHQSRLLPLLLPLLLPRLDSVYCTVHIHRVTVCANRLLITVSWH